MIDIHIHAVNPQLTSVKAALVGSSPSPTGHFPTRTDRSPTFAWIVASCHGTMARLSMAVVLAMCAASSAGCTVVATEVAEGQTEFTLPFWELAIKVTLFLLVGTVTAIVFLFGCFFLLKEAVFLLKIGVRRIRERFAIESRDDSTGRKEVRIDWGLLPGFVFLALFLFFLAIPLFFMPQIIHETVYDKIMLSDSSFVTIKSHNFRMHREEYRFDEIRSLRKWSGRRGRGKKSVQVSYVDITLRSGQQETIPCSDILYRVWPEIVRQATAKGVVVEGDGSVVPTVRSKDR